MTRKFKDLVSLASFTTFHIGGPARLFAEIHAEEDLKAAFALARERGLPLYVLGGGSNVLVADEGFNGIVLAMRSSVIAYEDYGDNMIVTADAGVVWDDLVAETIERGFAGLECLSGVPGTVGGAVVANIGAYGAQCSDTFIKAEVIDIKEGNTSRLFRKEDCDFSYHDSIFARERGRYIITRISFMLGANGASQPVYQDNRFNLAEFATKNGHKPSLSDIRNAVLDVREQKGALCMEGRLSYDCAGSFFHMPFVSAQQHKEIEARAQVLDAEKERKLRPWAWGQPDGSYKLAPGFLLEYTEFQKGYVRGAVGISPKHTLSIINIAGARARDVASLARDMQDTVEEIFNVRLEREVEYLGNVE